MVRQLELFGETPYQRHSETSRAAAEHIEPRSGTLRAVVLRCLRTDGPMTDEDLQIATGMGESTERPRRVELVRAGLVRDSGQRCEVMSGRLAVLWEAVPS
jgi:hypothetical protein